MPIIIRLTNPLEGQDAPFVTELGPFEKIGFSYGYFIGDGVQVAEIFTETADDMMSCVTGHPAAGCVVTPRTFHGHEEDHPLYPGKAYERAEIIEAKSS